MTQLVQHKSRNIESTLNFTATENILSWAFTQEGDGEIYEISATNVATLSIDGNSVTLPFVGAISVTNGSGYGVAITKTTNGQTASVTIKSRRAVSKTSTVSVPDYGAYNGRYLYMLLSNGTVAKYDSALLVASNYVGSGVWTVSPLVATITLPTPPDGGVWSAMCFIKTNNIPRMIVFSRLNTTSTSNMYACYIRISDNAVYDLTMTTLNGYTNITTYILHTTITSLTYDYVNEVVIAGFTGSAQFPSALKLTTNTFTQHSNLAYNLPNNKCGLTIVPTENKLSSIGMISLANLNKSTAAIQGVSFGLTSGFAYYAGGNKIVSGGNNYCYAFSTYAPDGTPGAGYNVTNGATMAGNCLTRLFRNIDNVFFAPATSNNFMSWYQIGTGKNKNYQLTAGDIASGQTGAYDACFSDYSRFFHYVGNPSLGRRRLFVVELDIPNQLNIIRYLDTAVDINQIQTNQLNR